MKTKNTRLVLAIFGILMGIIVSAQTKGTPRLNVYFTTGFNDSAWQKAAFDKVANAWMVATPPAAGKRSVVTATIGRDGKVTSSQLTTESGSAGWDKAALEAVQKASPFGALPKSWTPATLEVHFHFSFIAS